MFEKIWIERNYTSYSKKCQSKRHDMKLDNRV